MMNMIRNGLGKAAGAMWYLTYWLARYPVLAIAEALNGIACAIADAREETAGRHS